MLATQAGARTGYASQGVVLGSGVAADYEADIAEVYSLDSANLEYDIASRQWQKRVEGVNLTNQSNMYARQAASLDAARGPTLLGGIFSTIGDAVEAVGKYVQIGSKMAGAAGGGFGG